MSELLDPHDLKFFLHDWLKLGELLDRKQFSDHSMDTIDAMLDVTHSIAENAIAPSLRIGDEEEPFLDSDQQVRVCPKVKDGVQSMIDNGIFGMPFEEKFGGLQLPFSVYVAAMGMLHAASSATTFFMMLTTGNARVIADSDQTKLFEAFGAPQVAGKALGTMCLSEPHAGSSLGDITTKALPDGSDDLGERYRITGSKMWISGGDQDVTDNIIHLVLAKIPNEDGKLPSGSRGISLFVVPKILPDGQRNDIVASGLNHKLGGRSLPNCAMNLGEGFAAPDGSRGAIGWRLGQPGKGLALMFQMMNEMRISVGVSAAMMAMRGFRLSSAYARDRAQGRSLGQVAGSQVPIIEHVDVRRMLLSQKAVSEGALALTLYTAWLQDDEKTNPDPAQRVTSARLLGFLTPITKSWPAEFAQTSLHDGIQVLGGAGFTRDFELELLWRDNRISPIYEGTTGVQAIDLVNRKIRRDNGETYQLLRDRVSETLSKPAKSLTSEVSAVSFAWERIDLAVEKILNEPDEETAIVHATALLTAMGHGVIAWMWLDMAQTSLGLHGDPKYPETFLKGKVAAFRHFVQSELPHVEAWLDPLMQDADATVDVTLAELVGEI